MSYLVINLRHVFLINGIFNTKMASIGIITFGIIFPNKSLIDGMDKKLLPIITINKNKTSPPNKSN